MQKIITGKTYVLGKNIDTDQIYPGRYLELTDAADIVKHVLEGADESFPQKIKAGDIIVAGTNFGCGSSREQAAVALRTAGLGAVVAESFARIFYRNGINMGLPLITSPGITQKIKEGDVISIDITSGEVKNQKGEVLAKAEPISDYMLNILEHGGIKPLLAKRFV